VLVEAELGVVEDQPHDVGAYATAVLISLFISIAPSPTTATARRPLASAAPTPPVVKWPIEPHAALVR